MNFVECLLHVGFNPNAKEKCGIASIIISAVLKSEKMCQLLVKSRACVRGPLFTNVPIPMAVAKKMELAEILEILNPTSSDEEDDDLCSYDPTFQSVQSPGFITGVVGDVGTCITNCGVMSRSSSYDWVGIICGTMHTKGYLAEACFKEQGPGQFHYLVHKVLKRQKAFVNHIPNLKCYCDENSSSRKFPFLLATTLLLHQKCLCKISGEHD